MPAKEEPEYSDFKGDSDTDFGKKLLGLAIDHPTPRMSPESGVTKDEARRSSRTLNPPPSLYWSSSLCWPLQYYIDNELLLVLVFLSNLLLLFI